MEKHLQKAKSATEEFSGSYLSECLVINKQYRTLKKSKKTLK